MNSYFQDVAALIRQFLFLLCFEIKICLIELHKINLNYLEPFALKLQPAFRLELLDRP